MARKTLLFIIPLLLVGLSIVFFNIYHNEVKAESPPQRYSKKMDNVSVGAWIPSNLYLERMNGANQTKGIDLLISQGFNEYYFVMRNFSDSTERRTTEALLNSADGTHLKILIILLPFAEGGTQVNYDWKGWINYFNFLKEKHSSFKGFVLDDFNAFVNMRRIYVTNNMDLMALSNFSTALYYKRNDVQFYPVMYLETGGFQTLKKQYSKYIAGLTLVSILYRSISHLENDIMNFSKMFDKKPIKFIVYPSINQLDPLPNRLIMATLSIASRSADGLIIYRNTTHPIVQDYLLHHKDPQFLTEIRDAEKTQIKQEIIESEIYPSVRHA